MQSVRFNSIQSLDKSWRVIAPLVIASHLLLIVLTEFYSAQKPSIPSSKKQALIVQTVALNPAKPKTSVTKQVPATAIKAEESVVKEDSKPKAEKDSIEPSQPKSTPSEEPVKEEIPKQEIKKVEKPEPPKPKSPAPSTKKPATKTTPKKAAPPKAKPAPKKETVKPKKAVAKVPASPAKAKAAAPKKTETKPKTETVKAKQETKAKASAAEAAAKTKRLELIANAQKSIANVSHSEVAVASSNVTSESLSVEKAIEASEGTLTAKEVTYYDELASRLKLLLRLPDFGEVRIKLTLDRTGKFMKVLILNTESSANKKYIEKTLPTLKYPAFGNNFTGKQEYTFSISLSNEI